MTSTYPPYFSGSKLPVDRGYKEKREVIVPGLRESIRSVTSNQQIVILVKIGCQI